MRRRTKLVLLGALAAVAVAAVAIPSASGGRVAPTTARHLPQFQHSSRYVARHLEQRYSARSTSRRLFSPPRSTALTCEGGSITPGTYSRLTIDGECTVDQGPVMVQHNVTVTGNGVLLAIFSNYGSKLVVGGNLNVQTNGVVLLGCDPEAFSCSDDASGTSKGVVFGSMNAQGAYALIIHDTSITHDLMVNGGGGGVNCNGPAYGTFEDVSVGGDLTIENWQSCWLGLIRTAVGHNASFHDNTEYLLDGNEVVTNSVKNTLDCYNNDPAAQVGDSEGNLNLVLGHATNECASLTWPGP